VAMITVQRWIVFGVAVLLGINLLVADAIVIRTYQNWNDPSDTVTPVPTVTETCTRDQSGIFCE